MRAAHDDIQPLLHVLVASSIDHECALTRSLLGHLSLQDNVSTYSLLDGSLPPAAGDCVAGPSPATATAPWNPSLLLADGLTDSLVVWTDLLIIAPLDADTLARMLQGMADSPLLRLLRGWDVSKKILLIPGMSRCMWENPMTKKQLSKIRRKWNWIRVLQPLLWMFEHGERKQLPWEGMDELNEAVQTQLDLMTIGRDLKIDMSTARVSNSPSSSYASRRLVQKHIRLPPELWSMILEFTGDWELATALHVHTNLPRPAEWAQLTPDRLEWTVLTGDMTDITTFLKANPPTRLSMTIIRLIMRFAMVPLLRYLETFHQDVCWRYFAPKFLPDKASSVFGRVELLDYWHTSPFFMKKDYSSETMDGASKAGFTHILEWWQTSGLQLRYTESALEQASSHGQLQVLEWWRQHSGGSTASALERSSSPSLSPLTTGTPRSGTPTTTTLRLKVGKSISYATQAGSLPAVRWWSHSGIPFSYEETVAKLASTHGHVAILQYWHSLKGEKLIFDNQVLVGATKMGHVDVLEWWKCSGLRVEYKTCDVEEALEDGVEGVRGEMVRRWWARNGLNLGVGTSEWMRTKLLG